ncbi:MAG: RecQ family ATP-dependent DNA helicase [Oceanicaulis sp.]|nr:RecQ family ATP-dependent DNA helicase [Oceanicaulis sp.]
MTLRTARRGANAGGKFWGCSQYPRCNGTRSFIQEDPYVTEHPAVDVSDSRLPGRATAGVARRNIPVAWRDGTPRPEWDTVYVSVGSTPAFLSALRALKTPKVEKLLSDTAIFINRSKLPYELPEPATEFISQIVQKLLQRGLTPLPTISLETAIAEVFGTASLQHFDETSPEVGWRITGAFQPLTESGLVKALCTRRPDFKPEARIPVSSSEQQGYDSGREQYFATSLLPGISPELCHWLHPQTPFQSLAPDDPELAAAKRVDFLLARPDTAPVIIELDGEEHEHDARIDAERDAALEAHGFKVVRIPNTLIDNDDITSLTEFLTPYLITNTAKPTKEELKVARLSLLSSIGSKIQFVLCDALSRRALLPSEHWKIHVTGADPVAAAAISDFHEILRALDKIYGTMVSPKQIEVTLGEKTESDPHLSILVETEIGEKHAFPDDAEHYVYIIRPTYLPRDLTLNPAYVQARRYCIHRERRDQDTDEIESATTVFLQYLFRKTRFRQGQFQALLNGLCGYDSIVLLPTGAGKSIIYQLTGLLQPGITLVVDPLVSLIEDQERILKSYGIERVLGVTSGSFSERGTRNELLNSIKEAQFQFIMISPERLQTPEFRDALRSLTQHALVNSAVIDEAHCVSEWGHDFRPAYLNLARNLRDFCRDREGKSPALFALTGTASRAVLRDMLVDLGIDPSNSHAIVRPTGFDRKELEFDLIKCQPKDVVPTLEGVLASLPKRFRVTPGDFVANRGGATMSGIVFCPTVKGQKGVLEIQQIVSRVLGAPVSIYSGSSPGASSGDWNAKKKENARSFIENEVPAIVSTKAFGMGIDKPNVRYTVHVGMPGSLEAFYQEAGRAGRDQKRSICIALYAESDEDRTRRILSSELTNDEVESLLKQEPWNARSDANTAMFFHRGGYPGVEEEVSWVRELLQELGAVDHRQNITIARGRDGASKQIEKAIFRLLQIGMISDYTVDYGGGKYSVEVEPFDPEKAKLKILDYIRRSQPGRAKTDEEALNHMELSDGDESLIRSARYLISFAYDVIEQARRRAIAESFEAARIGSIDKSAFRKRLLEYLEEGVSSDFLEGLLAKDHLNISEWLAILPQINNAAEAGEFRGIAIRYLESYPEHPGLLLLRAVSESMSGDCDLRRVREDIQSAIRFGEKVYGISKRDMMNISAALCDLALERAHRIVVPLLVSLGEGDGWVPGQEVKRVRSLLFSNFPYETKTLRATHSIRKLSVSLAGLNHALHKATAAVNI